MSIKANVVAYLPVRWRWWLRNRRADLLLLREVWRDWLAFRRGSGLHETDDPTVLNARVMKSAHRIEKGLALPRPRLGFGVDAIESLLRDLDARMKRCGADEIARSALDVLQSYLDFHAGHGMAMESLRPRVRALQALAAGGGAGQAGGLLHLRRTDVLVEAGKGFAEVAMSRHSVRQFAPGAVPPAQIETAVRCAQMAPSVCNRQSGRVYVVRDRDLMARLFAHQNGNRGFGDQAEVLLIVVSDLRSFLNVGERYQAWIDGGMFAMSLVHGLHSQGLGTCCLNWSVTRAQDRAFKAAAGLQDWAEIMMLVAVGRLPEEFTVARSARRPLTDVLRTLGPADRTPRDL